MIIDRIVVKNGVVRFVDTGLIPETYELIEMAEAGRIMDHEVKKSSDTRAWEMVEV
jgi:hypothetical protein